MIYPFMTLADNTVVVHSDIDEKGMVKVYFEKPIHLGFKSVEVYLPSYEWKNNEGFTDDELDKLDEYVHSVAHIIIDLAQNGGFDNAANF